jgi:hypothetical protein
VDLDGYSGSRGLAHDATSIYFGGYTAYVHRLPKAGGPAARIAWIPQFAPYNHYPGSIAVDSTGIWVCTNLGLWKLVRPGEVVPKPSPPDVSASKSGPPEAAIAKEGVSRGRSAALLGFLIAALAGVVIVAVRRRS